ncbi:hypothetical protein BVRB_8g198860 [Beta vulgaris subsp. vulgaris]|nr:hypothetical protein BVRB_8g198860 [Beta vulgaris subsp. vulgaris]
MLMDVTILVKMNKKSRMDVSPPIQSMQSSLITQDS